MVFKSQNAYSIDMNTSQETHRNTSSLVHSMAHTAWRTHTHMAPVGVSHRSVHVATGSTISSMPKSRHRSRTRGSMGLKGGGREVPGWVDRASATQIGKQGSIYRISPKGIKQWMTPSPENSTHMHQIMINVRLYGSTYPLRYGDWRLFSPSKL